VEYIRPSLVKAYRAAGFDFVYIEYEHGFFDPPGLSDFVLSGRDNDLPAVAKTPDLERHSVAKLLEAGVIGIQLPRTNTREDIDRLVSYMKFPPIGTRAGAPGYGNTDYGDVDPAEFLRKADEQTLVVAHIEMEEGVNNIEAIVGNPHIDVVLVGPFDLSISLGVPGQMRHPRMVEAMTHVYDAARHKGMATGYAAMVLDDAVYWLERGVRFFELASELDMIRHMATEIATQFRRRIRS
jgi:2-keto-3-deoxy-L-rhamnonate aldolase RhmA